MPGLTEVLPKVTCTVEKNSQTYFSIPYTLTSADDLDTWQNTPFQTLPKIYSFGFATSTPNEYQILESSASQIGYIHNEHSYKSPLTSKGITIISKGITIISKGITTNSDGTVNFKYNCLPAKDFTGIVNLVYINNSKLGKLTIDVLEPQPVVTTTTAQEAAMRLASSLVNFSVNINGVSFGSNCPHYK